MIRAPGSPPAVSVGSFCPAGVLVEKEPQRSVPLLLGAEAPQCRPGQGMGEQR